MDEKKSQTCNTVEREKITNVNIKDYNAILFK